METVTFISDRGTGLVPALSEVFPEISTDIVLYTHWQEHCGWFKVKALAALVYNAAKKTTKEERDRWLEEIKGQVKEPLSTLTALNTSYGPLMQWTNLTMDMSHQALQSPTTVC